MIFPFFVSVTIMYLIKHDKNDRLFDSTKAMSLCRIGVCSPCSKQSPVIEFMVNSFPCYIGVCCVYSFPSHYMPSGKLFTEYKTTHCNVCDNMCPCYSYQFTLNRFVVERYDLCNRCIRRMFTVLDRVAGIREYPAFDSDVPDGCSVKMIEELPMLRKTSGILYRIGTIDHELLKKIQKSTCKECGKNDTMTWTHPGNDSICFSCLDSKLIDSLVVGSRNVMLTYEENCYSCKGKRVILNTGDCFFCVGCYRIIRSIGTKSYVEPYLIRYVSDEIDY